MPAVSPQLLVDAVIGAFEESGASAVLLSSVRKHPRQFFVRTDVGGVQVWVYIWTLTQGGRAYLPDEYRIQMTTVVSPLPINPSGPTLLLGYEPNFGAFAGFDISIHKTFTTGSPSVQVSVDRLHQALQDGFSFGRKTNREVTVGIRSDQLLNYMSNVEDLHRHGKNAKMCGLLARASTLESITNEELDGLSLIRQKVVSEVSRWARSASFRQQVLCAYGNRCAVTRMQLRLVEAAHILPVHTDESTDRVNNGLALSPTYHRAFDHGLIYLDDRYVMRLNQKKATQLTELKLNNGIRGFERTLNRTIHLPHDSRQRPSLSMIRKANRYRRISV